MGTGGRSTGRIAPLLPPATGQRTRSATGTSHQARLVTLSAHSLQARRTACLFRLWASLGHARWLAVPVPIVHRCPLHGDDAVSLDHATAARTSAELARAGVAGDRHGIDAALLALLDDFGSTEVSEDNASLLLATQAKQIGVLAEELAHALDVDLDAVFILVGKIELPK